MSKPTTISISLYGDAEYLAAFKVIVARNKTTVGKFIRQLIDDNYGTEIQQTLGEFDTDRMEASANAIQALIDGGK